MNKKTIEIRKRTPEEVMDFALKTNTENIWLKHNWKDLKKWIEEQYEFITQLPPITKEIALEHKIMANSYKAILEKMEELEGEQLW